MNVKKISKSIGKAKTKFLNSTPGQFSRIYLCKSGVYSFICQRYTLPVPPATSP